MDAPELTEQLTRTFAEADQGQALPVDRLFGMLYDDLRHRAQYLMSGERTGHTLTTTALVHEAYVRLAVDKRNLQTRKQFFGLAARAMRHILVDHARGRLAIKRGAGQVRALPDNVEDVPLRDSADTIDWLALDEALDRLKSMDERRYQVVMLRFFAGRMEEEIGDLLGVDQRTVRRDWATARLWLKSEMLERQQTGA
jgi:RNA polymerase sigma factor (TIGR02999 family)